VANGINGYVGAFTTGGSATGIAMRQANATISNDGIIEVAGGAGGIGIALSAGGTLLNNGAIYASGTAASAAGIGVAVSGTGTLLNTGLISANITVLVTLGEGGTFTLDNSGTLDGSVVAHASAGSISTIINDGNITGDVQLGGGSDIYDGASGNLSGSLFAGAGMTA